MKILVVGNWLADIYEPAFFEAFAELGHKTYKFSWVEYFKNYQYADKLKTDGNPIRSFYYKFQNKFLIGPVISSINKDLIALCLKVRPDLIFVYRGTHIYGRTLKTIKKLCDCKIFGYNNDDPFGEQYSFYVWRHFKQGLQHYDHIFAYRHRNIADFRSLGCQNVSLLRSYYLKEQNYYIRDSAMPHSPDVVFIGHYENDGRDECIKKILDCGINLQLYGTRWKESKHYGYFKKTFGRDIRPLYDDEYNAALNAAKIALVFLSKYNNDSYTRRCFEIPATKTMMLCERTKDMQQLFTEDEEAVYFSDSEECVDKVKYFLKHDKKRKQIANNGYQCLLRDGHEVLDRAKKVIKIHQDLE